MPLIVFSEYHKENLSFLTTLSAEYLEEFCKAAIEFMQKGGNKRVFTAAAQNLNVDAGDVESGIEALIQFFKDACSMKLNQGDFRESLTPANFDDAKKDTLWQYYSDNLELIRKICQELSLPLPEYNNLDWRLDVQIGSRCARQQLQPSFTLRLETTGPTGGAHILQADITTLQNITKELKSALNEVNTYHFRRTQRFIK